MHIVRVCFLFAPKTDFAHNIMTDKSGTAAAHSVAMLLYLWCLSWGRYMFIPDFGMHQFVNFNLRQTYGGNPTSMKYKWDDNIESFHSGWRDGLEIAGLWGLPGPGSALVKPFYQHSPSYVLSYMHSSPFPLNTIIYTMTWQRWFAIQRWNTLICLGKTWLERLGWSLEVFSPQMLTLRTLDEHPFLSLLLGSKTIRQIKNKQTNKVPETLES